MLVAIAVLVLVAQEDVLPVLNVVETTAAVPAAVRHRVRIAAIDAVHHPIRVREVVIVDAIREEGKHPFLYHFFFCFSLFSLSLPPCGLLFVALFLSLLLLMFLFLFLAHAHMHTHLYTHNTSLSQVGKLLFFMPEQGKKKRVEGIYTYTHTYMHTYKSRTCKEQGTRHEFLPLFPSNM